MSHGYQNRRTSGSFRRWNLLALLVGAVVCSGPAAGADALRGKTLYFTTPGGISCANSACHGTTVSSGRNNILKGANSPSTIQNAINGDTGGMGIYRGVLTATDVADIAAYIANPGVTGAPAASVSPTRLSFGSVDVGLQSGTQTVTVRSTGTTPLNIASIATTTADFPVSGGTCRAGTSVAVGASCTVLARFVPSAAGLASATLTIGYGGTPSASVVALDGTGVALSPSAQIAPAGLTFSQAVGSASTPQTVTLSNTGTGTLHLTSVGFRGTAAGDYATGAGTDCAAGLGLAPGGSCSVDIVFTPTTAGARSASLAIVHDDTAHSPSTVTLSGTGTALPQAQLSVDRASLSWPAQPQGTASTARTATVSNTGSATGTFTGVDLGGTDPQDFVLAPSASACLPGASLAVGATCTLTVRFQPTVSSGTRSATLTVHSDAVNDPLTLGLDGIAAAAPAPAVAFTPNRLAFGQVALGASAAALSSRLENPGTAPLTILGLSSTSTEFVLTHDCGSSISPGGFCTLNVVFAPVAQGVRGGGIRLTSDAAGSPHRLALDGTGVVAPTAALAWLSATPLAFPDTAVGSRSSARQATLSSIGTGGVGLQQIAISGADAADFVLGPATDCPVGGTLASGARCTIAIVFTPSAAGTRTAQLDVLGDADPGPIDLSGIGVGVAGLPLLTVAPEFMTLSGPTNEGLQPQALVLSNAGTAPLQITGFVVPTGVEVGVDAAKGGTCSPIPFQLQPGQTCSVMVIPGGGAVNGAITVLSNSDPAPPTVKVSGEPLTNAGAGGCSIGRPDAPFDPVWLVMLGGALAGLWLRRTPRHPNSRLPTRR